ncbi:MAG: hypothetical protein DI529_15965 [Chryseobacterium sp.]|nr:MAG: hypothetical protein DI529_15965 [Chryseobacterium sp.]
MKLRLSIILSAIILLFSCRGDEEEIQVIDQVLNLYMKNSAGQDLLNTNIDGSYSSAALYDLLNETALTSVTSSLLKDSNGVIYMEYLAGATRLLKDSVSPSQKTFESEVIIRLSKTVDEETVVDDDTIRIEYNWTPTLFQLSKLWYNDELKFTKVQGQPNIVTIVK